MSTMLWVNHTVLRPFQTGQIKNSDIGLNIRICRLRLVVGCSEKILKNNTMPTIPVAVIHMMSNHFNVFFLVYS